MAFVFDAHPAPHINGGAATTSTWSHTVGSGPHRLLVVMCIRPLTTSGPTAVTYGGVALTQYGSTLVDTTNSRGLMQFWYLIDPTPGTANIVATHPSSAANRFFSASFICGGIPQTDGSPAFAMGDVASDLTTVTATPTVAGALIVDGAWVNNSSPATARGVSQTVLTDVDAGSTQNLSSYALNMPASAYAATHFASAWGTGDDFFAGAAVFTEAPAEEVVEPPAATGTGAAAAPAVVARVPVPASAASGAAAAPTPVATVKPPAAPAAGAAAVPTIRAIVLPPAAGASDAGAVPSPRLTVVPQSAGASGGAAAPSISGVAVFIQPPASGATGTAGAPLVATISAPSSAGSNGSAAAPTLRLVSLPPAAASTGAAAAPTVTGPGEFIVSPSAGATGGAAAPATRLIVLPPAAAAGGNAGQPGVVARILPPASGAAGAAPVVTVRILVLPPAAVVFGGASDQTVVGAGDFALPVPIVTPGRGGGVTMAVALWRATIDNVLLEDLSAHGVEGSVSMNLDRAVKLAASFTLPDPDRVTPYVDYLAPFLTLEFDDGSPTIARQLGLFAVRVPPATRGPDSGTATFAGEDLTTILANSAYSAPDEVPNGTLFRAELIQTIEEAGITRYSIPNTTRTTGYHRTYPPGSTRMEKVTRLTERMRMYQPYMDLEGRLATQNTFSKRVTEPYVTITDEDLLEEIQIQPSDLQIANVVIVVRDNANEAPLSGVARDDDPGSPTSTVTIGREIVRVVRVQELEDQADADDQAARYLEEGKSYYRTARLVTLPNAHFGFHQVLDVALTGHWGALNGRWMVRAWDVGFSPESVALVQTVNQLTSALSEEAA